MCFLWTGTFLHDIDQLEFSFLGNGVKQNDEVHSGHHHGHSHIHSDGHSKQIRHTHGSTKELPAVAGEEMHGHDPLLLGFGHRDGSSDELHLAAVVPMAFAGMGFASKSAAIIKACRPRSPPGFYKVPIYLLNRTILI
jgi:hypothetical protein